MDYLVLLTIVSGIITIITLFIPDRLKTKKGFIYCAFILIVFISGWLTQLNTKLERIESIQKAAKMLIEKQGSEFTERGFIQAGLSFMEINKDLYPDTYQRAVKIYEKLNNAKYSYEEVDAAYEMKGLIKGISILNEEK